MPDDVFYVTVYIVVSPANRNIQHTCGAQHAPILELNDKNVSEIKREIQSIRKQKCVKCCCPACAPIVCAHFICTSMRAFQFKRLHKIKIKTLCAK